ncbi:MAG: carbohydrate ABC transporter permease [Acutalibacteraceae bacterium]
MRKNKSALFEKRARYGYIFIAPLILGVCLIFIPNLIETFLYSVCEIDTANNFALNFSGFGFYKEAFRSDPQFLPLLGDNLKDLVINVPIIVIYSLFIATLLNQEFKGRVIARIIFFIPVLLATGVLSDTDSTALLYTGAGQVIDTGVTSGSGFADMTTLLSSLSFPKPLIDVVTGAVSNIYTITRSSGLQIFIFLAGLQEIPTSVYEAASIEGCSKWELFWKITFPMIAPQIAVNAIYTIAISATDNNALLTYSNTLAFGESNYSLATAMNIIYLLALGVFVMIVLALIGKFSSNTEN